MGGEERGRKKDQREKRRGAMLKLTLASVSQSAFQEDLCDRAVRPPKLGQLIPSRSR